MRVRAASGHAGSQGGAVELASLGAALAEALSGVHAAGLTHRDLKPSNIVIGRDGPKVLDFGIAKSAAEESLTAADEAIGSPGFIAPEQLARDGEPGPAADVFALGAVLTLSATGRAPFGMGGAPAVLYRTLHDEPDLEGVPEPSWRAFLGRCLARDPADRPPVGEILTWCGARAADSPWWEREPVSGLVRRHEDEVAELVAGAEEEEGEAGAASPPPSATGTDAPPPLPSATGTDAPPPLPSATGTDAPPPPPSATGTDSPPPPSATGTDSPPPEASATSTGAPPPEASATSTGAPPPKRSATRTDAPPPKRGGEAADGDRGAVRLRGCRQSRRHSRDTGEPGPRTGPTSTGRTPRTDRAFGTSPNGNRTPTCPATSRPRLPFDRLQCHIRLLQRPRAHLQ
ncbi:protein kinase [Streptomyces sp. NPDC050147]|uniref:protein kinase domain-containing protein n=1 Tax=Streptomyces sp. NPDC050147 TaxID=3155513 RepID=UPI0034336380